MGIRAIVRGENDIDFARWWRRGAVLSVVLIVLSVASLGIRGLNLSVEFTGGISVEVIAPDVSVDQARSALADAGLGSAKVQIVGQDTLRVQTAEEAQEVQDQLRDILGDLAGLTPEQLDQQISVSTVSPSWGDDITNQSVRALVFFLLAILAYLTIRLELRMAIGAIIAVVHDIVISVGVYSVAQFEVSPGTVIAFLTILGYSIYDTVVVYDKVKENESRASLAGRMTYTEMVSLSMNQVLLRSLNTSITSILPVISLLVIGAGILGAVTIGQFAIALLVGLLVGTYSSIMVAAPAVAWMKEREPRFRQLRERLEQTGVRSTGPVVDGAPDDEGPGDGGATTTSPAPATATTGTGVIAPKPRKGAIPPRPRKKGKR